MRHPRAEEQLANNKSDRQSRRTSPLTAPLASGFAGVWGPSCAFGIKYRKGSPGSRGSLTSRPLRRCLFPLFAVGVFATTGTLDRVGKHGVIVQDHSTQRGVVGVLLVAVTVFLRYAQLGWRLSGEGMGLAGRVGGQAGENRSGE